MLENLILSDNLSHCYIRVLEMDFFNLKKPTVLLGVPKGAAAIHINSTTTHTASAYNA